MNLNFTEFKTFDYRAYRALFKVKPFKLPQYGYLKKEAVKVNKAINSPARGIMKKDTNEYCEVWKR